MKIYLTGTNVLARKENGFSLVELMISITIGLFLLIGMTSLLVSNSNTRSEMEKAGRQIENGRYAIDLLRDDLMHAGYYGEFSDITGSGTTGYCSTVLSVMQANMVFPVYGDNDVSAAPTCGTALNFAANTDILVVRRAGTETPIAVGAVVPTQHYLQSTPEGVRLDLGSAGVASFNLKQKDGVTPALLRKYLTHVYFIDKEGDIPILKRAELNNGTFTTVSMVEGIENLQVEYGVDTNGDGAPDSYATAGAVSSADWKNVVTVRLYILARNNDISVGWDDSKKTYTLGSVSPITSITPAGNDTKYKRHVYTAVIRLNNPSGRREL